MKELKIIGFIIFKFVLFIILIMGIFHIMDSLYDEAELFFALSAILSAFILGLLSKRDYLKYEKTHQNNY